MYISGTTTHAGDIFGVSVLHTNTMLLVDNIYIDPAGTNCYEHLFKFRDFLYTN